MVATERLWKVTKRWVPSPIEPFLRSLHARFADKYYWGLEYWRNCHQQEGGRFTNQHYRGLMMSLAEQEDRTLLEGKVVPDFGCGPRGSLAWATDASLSLGIRL